MLLHHLLPGWFEAAPLVETADEAGGYLRVFAGQGAHGVGEELVATAGEVMEMAQVTHAEETDERTYAVGIIEGEVSARL